MDITLKALAEFPDRLAVQFGAFGRDQWSFWPASWDTCPAEHFTALEQICHVRDIETDGYHVRFRRTLSESRPFLPGVDGYLLREQRDYAHADPDAVLNDFRAGRQYTLGLLSSLHDADWNRPAEFEDYGPTTLRGLVHYLASHDAQHLSGLQWLLGKIEAED